MYSVTEKVFIIQSYYKLNNDKFLVRKKFKRKYSNIAPSNLQITRLITKFELTGSVLRTPSINTRRPSGNVNLIDSHFQQNPNSSVRTAAQALHVSSATIHTVLRKNLKYKPYKTQTRQLLSANATVKRLHFANTLDIEILDKVWFTDESYFYLNPKANKNEVFWSKTKPIGNFVQKPAHSAKVLVWMAISHHGVFWRPIEGIMNSKSYIHLLKHQFIPYLKSRNLINTCIFMQDGAPCHTSKDSLKLIHKYFKDRVISTRYPEKYNMGLEWPPYSPDLTPLDFCIWGTLKARLTKHKPQTLMELSKALHKEVSLFTQQFIINAIGNVIPRLESLRIANGGHFEN